MKLIMLAFLQKVVCARKQNAFHNLVALMVNWVTQRSWHSLISLDYH